MYPPRLGVTTMPVTLTIKQVPERLAIGLRRRAAANRRSQQQELLLMLERAVDAGTPPGNVAEPTHPVYLTGTAHTDKRRRKASTSADATTPRAAGKLGLDALWERARRLGVGMRSESAAIVRTDRDAGRR